MTQGRKQVSFALDSHASCVRVGATRSSGWTFESPSDDTWADSGFEWKAAFRHRYCSWTDVFPSVATALLLTLVDPATYVGNVYGTVTDDSDAPIAGALVMIVDSEQTVRSCRTDSSGNFLINSVPAPYDGRDYTIIVTSEDKPGVSVNVRVLPGAVMALELRVHLGAVSRVEHRYRHEDETRPQASDTAGANYTKTVFATREGLVGGTTANGHVIVTNDHFVALPSRRALSTNFGHEREVRLTYGGRTVVAPVWDIGPWNIHDDHWNPPEIRETFKDLPRGKPEAEAAFLEGYNGGLDERGRLVRNPAGIDLADGTFWIDLAMLDNDRVEVEYLWLDSAGPETSDVLVLPNPATASLTITIDASATDASPISGAELFVDSIGADGFGFPATAADGAFDSATEAITANYSTAGWIEGSMHTIYLHARDAYGNWGTLKSATVSVVPQMPRRRRAVRGGQAPSPVRRGGTD